MPDFKGSKFFPLTRTHFLQSSSRSEFSTCDSPEALSSLIPDVELANYVSGKALRQREILDIIKSEALDAGIADETLLQIDEEIANVVENDPPQWTEESDLGADSFNNTPGYWHFATNPSDMETGIRYAYYGFGALGIVSATAATGGAIYYGPTAAFPTFTAWGIKAGLVAAPSVAISQRLGILQDKAAQLARSIEQLPADSHLARQLSLRLTQMMDQIAAYEETLRNL